MGQDLKHTDPTVQRDAALELAAIVEDVEEYAFAHEDEPDDTHKTGVNACLALARLPLVERFTQLDGARWLERADALAIDKADTNLRANISRERVAWARRAGRAQEARSLVEGILDEVARGERSLGVYHADVCFQAAALSRFFGDLAGAERRLEEGAAAIDPRWTDGGASFQRHARRLERTALVRRAELLLDLGLTDRAYPLLEEALAAEGADASIEVLALRASYLLSVDDLQELERFGAQTLARDDLPWTPTQRAQFARRVARGVAEAELIDPSLPRSSDAHLEPLLQGPELPILDRLAVLLALAYGDLHRAENARAASRLDACAGLLADAGLDSAKAPGTLALRMDALGARLAVLRGERDAIEAARTRLRTRLQQMAQQWLDARDVALGPAFLQFEDRRLFLGSLVEVELALAQGDAAAALTPVLMALALGGVSLSLADDDGPPRVPDVAALRAHHVPHDGGMLVFLPTADATHVFALDHGTLSHGATLGERALGRKARTLLEALERPTTDAAERDALARAAVDLTEALLPDALRPRLRDWSALTVCGLDALGYVPVECLRFADGWSVGQELAVCNLASPTLAERLAQRRPGARTKALFFVGAPREDPEVSAQHGVTPFDWPDAAVRRIVAPYADRRTDAWVGERATRAFLGAAPLAQASVLHVLAHGVQDPSRALPAGLLLSPLDREDRGVVWADDVPGAREGGAPCPPLVVLSACGAARGHDRRGDDGITHLGGAFLRAGARCVVLAHLDIDRAATTALMATFHERLVQGLSPARALLEARRAMAGGGEFAQPFDHSLVHAIGLGHEPVFATPPQRPRWPWAGGGLLVAVAAAVWLGLRRRTARSA